MLENRKFPNKNSAPSNGEMHTVTIVNRTADVEKRVLKLSQDQVAAEQKKLIEEQQADRRLLFNPKHWWRRAQLKYGEEYYRQKGAKKARKAIRDHDNAHLTMDTLNNGSIDASNGLLEERQAAQAKIEQIRLADQVQIDARQRIEEAHGPMKRVLIKEVLRPIVEGKLTSEHDVQEQMRAFVKNHQYDQNPEIRAQINRLFGAKANEFGRKADYFATDLLEVGKAIQEDMSAHGWAIEQMDQKVQIKLANSDWGGDTKMRKTSADSIVSRSRGTLNATAVGALTSIGAFALFTGTGRAVRALAMGAGVGGVVRGLERVREVNRDAAIHRIDAEYGAQAIDITPREGKRGRLTDMADSDTRRKLERYRYKELATIHDLLEGDNDTRNTLDDDTRGLKTLLGLDLSIKNELNRQALISRVAEIQERLRFSSHEQTGFIQYESQGRVEQGKLALMEGIVEGKQKLIEAYVNDGMDRPIAQKQVNSLVENDMAKWQRRLIEDKRDQDNEFTKFRVRSALAHGAFGGAVGFVAGLGIQEVIAGGGRLFGQRVEPTILQQWRGHGEPAVQTSASEIKEILSKSKAGDRMHFNGLDMHVEKNGRILVDRIQGQPLDAKLSSALHYDRIKNNFIYQGNMPAESASLLKNLGFIVTSEQINSVHAAHITKEVRTTMNTKEWLKQHSTQIKGWQWYDEKIPHPISDENELRQIDRRVGKHAIRWDSKTMGISTDTTHTLPPQDVPKLIKEGTFVRAFWDPKNPNNAIIVRSPNGVTVLDQHSKGMIEVLHNGKWVKTPESELAKIVFAKDLGKYDGAYSTTNFGNKINMNVSSGVLTEHGKFREFATDLSEGKKPKTIGAVASIHTPTSTNVVRTISSVDFPPDSWEAPAIAIVPFLRNPMRFAEARKQYENPISGKAAQYGEIVPVIPRKQIDQSLQHTALPIQPKKVLEKQPVKMELPKKPNANVLEATRVAKSIEAPLSKKSLLTKPEQKILEGNNWELIDFRRQPNSESILFDMQEQEVLKVENNLRDAEKSPVRLEHRDLVVNGLHEFVNSRTVKASEINGGITRIDGAKLYQNMLEWLKGKDIITLQRDENADTSLVSTLEKYINEANDNEPAEKKHKTSNIIAKFISESTQKGAVDIKKGDEKLNIHVFVSLFNKIKGLYLK